MHPNAYVLVTPNPRVSATVPLKHRYVSSEEFNQLLPVADALSPAHVEVLMEQQYMQLLAVTSSEAVPTLHTSNL